MGLVVIAACAPKERDFSGGSGGTGQELTGAGAGSGTTGGRGMMTSGGAEPGSDARCGDGVLNTGEECDNGDANHDTAPNACRLSCVLARCGDGVVDSNEQCDEAAGNSNTQSNACRKNCRLPSCGDGVLDSGESCDPGADASASNGCSATCVLSTCGNGMLDGLEQCDDGAGNDDLAKDACRKSCQRPRCGDSVVDSGEQCDQGLANSNTQSAACRKDCRTAGCGDGVADPDEECDGGELCTSDCKQIRCGNYRVDPGEGCDPPKAGSCSQTCKTAVCGNGTIEEGEECESGMQGGTSCSDECKLSRCGDGKVEGTEQCEPSLTAACTSSCRLPVCGNALIEAGELCDDGTNDGRYGGCNVGCKALAPRCGDGQVQGTNEDCEPPNAGQCDARCKTIPPTCTPTTEQCFNGVDDDCDGKVDCADSNCSPGAVCAPMGPRIGVLVPANSACPAGFTSSGAQVLHQEVTGGSCGGCSCAKTNPDCRAQVYYYATEAACTADSSGKGGTFLGEVTSTCPAEPFADEGEGFRVASITARQGTGVCKAQGTATLSSPTWKRDMRLCVTQNAGAGCANGQVCVPAAPSGAQLCSEKPSSGSCPSNFPQATWYESFQDTRSCGACACDQSGGSCGNMTVQIGNDWTCLDQVQLSSGQKKCDYAYAPPASLLGSPTALSCTARAPLSGNVSPTGARNLCCK